MGEFFHEFWNASPLMAALALCSILALIVLKVVERKKASRHAPADCPVLPGASSDGLRTFVNEIVVHKTNNLLTPLKGELQQLERAHRQRMNEMAEAHSQRMDRIEEEQATRRLLIERFIAMEPVVAELKGQIVELKADNRRSASRIAKKFDDLREDLNDVMLAMAGRPLRSRKPALEEDFDGEEGT